MKRIFSFFIISSICAVVVTIMAPLAHAYSLYPNNMPQSQSTSESTGFSQLLTPFTNFFTSVQSISPSDLNVNSGSQSPMAGIPAGAQENVRNGFYGFDTWLYGKIGFHISTIFIPILTLFSWILGFLNGIVNWLVNALHP
jgi:hypothetical protein